METVYIQMDLINQIKCLQNGYATTSQDKKTVIFLEKRLEVLESLWKAFVANHYRIIPNQSLKDIDYVKTNRYGSTQEFYLEFKTEMEELKEKLTKPKISLGNSTAETKIKTSNVKLPKISIPTFSGLYTEWISFRDLFVSLVHNNADIDDVQKLHYLKGYLTGEAEQLIRHMAITKDNYKHCWALLESRYDNKQYLVNCVLKKFFGQKNISVASSSAIKELLDNTVDTFNSLKSIGVNVASWDIIIIYIVSSKLDQETRKDWESKVSENAKFECLPTLNEFREFLETKFHSLEFLDSKQINRQKYQSNVNFSYHVAENVCVFCKRGDHKISNCKEFINLNADSKRNFVQDNRLCFNCLGDNHPAKLCRSNTSCHVCRRRHHSLLHPKGVSPQNERNNAGGCMQCNHTLPSSDIPLSDEPPIEDSQSEINSHFSKGSIQQVLLATALVHVESNHDTHLLRALIDQGSQASFITEAAVQMMGLKKRSARSLVSGLGGDNTLISKSTVEVAIISRHNPGCVINVKAYVLEKLTSYLPTKKFSFASELWPEVAGITLADPNYHTPNKIDLLLGAEIYGEIILEGLIKYPSGSLVAQNTTLGWILSGYCKADGSKNRVISMHTQVEEDFQLHELVKQFWEVEAEPKFEKRVLTVDEEQCEELYNATTKRDETGRYIVKLPFRDPETPACLQGQSRQIACRRFIGLEKKLSRNADLKKEFKKTFDEYLELGHMELVRDPLNTPSVYLPYHPVIREDRETTKVRVVFDASCKGSNGVSLNDDLMVGPKLQSDLRHIVMRWRTFPICFTTDIVKMYRQIRVDDNDANFQRILWREEPTDNLREYRLLRLTFGTSSAPYLAVKSLIQLAIDEGDVYKEAAERVKRDFYMDDLMSGSETEEEAIKIYKQLNELMEKGGFELQKWLSNSDRVLKEIKNEKDELSEEKRLDVEKDNKNKILGLTWNRRTDEFEYAVQLPPVTAPVTKRKVLSDVSRLYDPLGWIAPSIVSAKVFIQKLWSSGVQWDEELPPQLLQDWLTYREDLLHLTEFRLPRWMNRKKSDKLVELHGFSDASSTAYGAVVYMKVTDAEDNIHISLVTAKTRVASNTTIVTIPRLELCGAVLATKLLVEVAQVFDIPKQHLHAWTDSEVVLAWLSCHPSKWQTYVANRVSNILQHLNRDQWAHVMSEENPADYASRGLKPQDLIINQLWLSGPTWLKSKEIEIKLITKETNLEEKKTHKVHATQINEDEDEVWWKMSSLSKLLRVVAYCKRFLKKEKTKSKILEKEEIEEALQTIIKKTQKKGFSEELIDLQKGVEIKKKSKLTSFSPFLDEFGIIRIGGRIQQAHVAEDKKHPILIPHDAPLAKLLVADAHKMTLHGGPQIMRNYLRQKFWILGDKSLVKAQFRKCVTCVRYASSNKTPLMGQLPSPRVTPTRAFKCSGVDYAGPINIRVSKGRGNKSYKGYICLFICMSTRAIHLEAVTDLTTESFLAAFKRFVARRGYCSDLYSDNGTNFVGAARELEKLLKEDTKMMSQIAEWLANKGTKWHFIPPRSPNFGGLWEAGVKSTKYHLKRVIGDSTLTYEEMSTVLAQIEACLNSRPMTRLSEDNEETMALTPGHFLIGEPLLLAPDRSYEGATVSCLKRWHLCQRMTQDFWRRWSQEYLTHLMQRHKWTHMTPEPNIGDVVLVKEDDLPPAKWLLGRIIQKHPGPDNVTRVVTLKCKNSTFKRPISKLCILPVD